MKCRFTDVFMKQIKESPLAVCTCGHKKPILCPCGGILHLVDHYGSTEALCDSCGAQYFSYGLHLLHTGKIAQKEGGKISEPKHYPKPDYDRCNAGHKLVEVYDEKRNTFVWDCPICTKKMQEA